MTIRFFQVSQIVLQSWFFPGCLSTPLAGPLPAPFPSTLTCCLLVCTENFLHISKANASNFSPLASFSHAQCWSWFQFVFLTLWQSHLLSPQSRHWLRKQPRTYSRGGWRIPWATWTCWLDNRNHPGARFQTTVFFHPHSQNTSRERFWSMLPSQQQIGQWCKFQFLISQEILSLSDFSVLSWKITFNFSS